MGRSHRGQEEEIVVRVRRSTNKSTHASALDPEALYRLRGFPKDDDIEFVGREPINGAQELAAPEEGDRKDESSSTREP